MEFAKLGDSEDFFKHVVLRSTLALPGRVGRLLVGAMRTDEDANWSLGRWERYALTTVGDPALVSQVLQARFRSGGRKKYFQVLTSGLQPEDDVFLDPNTGVSACAGTATKAHLLPSDLIGLLPPTSYRVIGVYQHQIRKCGHGSHKGGDYPGHILGEVQGAQGIDGLGYWGGDASILFFSRSASRRQTLRTQLLNLAGPQAQVRVV